MEVATTSLIKLPLSNSLNIFILNNDVRTQCLKLVKGLLLHQMQIFVSEQYALEP